jgi:hypothetical protein
MQIIGNGLELVPHIEYWLNNTVASTTQYTPLEILSGASGNNLFQKYLPLLPEGMTKDDEVQEKIVKAYERMKQKIQKRSKRRRGNSKWKPVMNEKVLVRNHHNSDAVAGVTGKFIRPFEGPYIVRRLIPPSTVEVCDSEGKSKGVFNWKSIKPYQKAAEPCDLRLKVGLHDGGSNMSRTLPLMPVTHDTDEADVV